MKVLFFVKMLIYKWAKENIVMFVNVGSLLGTTIVTSVLGFIYWWLVARMFLPEAVGFASATISVMTLLGNVSLLGLGTLLIGELPHQSGNQKSLISAALIVAGCVAGCMGIIFALLAPFLSTDFHALSANFGSVMLFAVGISLTAITLVLDEALIGLLRGELQFWRNTIFAVVKLVALFAISWWLSYKVGLAIYATWAIGSLLSLIVLACFVLLKRQNSLRSYFPQWKLLRNLGTAALQHHGFNLALDVPLLVMPVLVTVMLSARANAWFYIALGISSLSIVLPAALATVLYAETSAQPTVLTYKIRLTISLAFAASIVTIGVLLIGTKQILGLFGHNYAEEAAWSLRILALLTLPSTIRAHYVAVMRIQKRVGRAILPIVGADLLQLVGAVLGARMGGLPGLCLGWLVADSIGVIFMIPRIYKVAMPVNIFPLLVKS